MWTFTIYGFQADPAGHRLNRPAPEVAAAYMRFCGCLAAFFPFGFMRAEFEEATSWQDIRNRVYVAYNKQLNAASLLQHVDFKWNDGENY